MALVVPASSSYRDVAGLVDAARRNPGKLNYGGGSASYRDATELFLTRAGVKANHVPYKGAAPALTDVAAAARSISRLPITAPRCRCCRPASCASWP
ncbi:tripartite tricarboxylate transporter substrate-binding protein [Cupriavidus basilensis]